LSTGPCGKEALEGSDRCIFHHPEMWKSNPELVREKIREQIEHEDFDFEGYYFPEVDLSDIVKEKEFIKPLNFKNTHFNAITFSCFRFKAAEFKGAKFSGYANFKKTIFSKTANFNGVEFSDVANFNDAEFKCNVEFVGARFAGTAYFSGAKFSGDADFLNARLLEYAYFRGTKFAGATGFENAEFFRHVFFSGSDFSDHSCFARAEFHGNAEFVDVEFSEVVSFVSTKFLGWTGFSNSKFHCSAIFNGVEFSGPVSFKDVRFLEFVDFRQAKFFERAVFVFAEFSRGADFSRADFSNYTDFGGADFSWDTMFFGTKFSSAVGFGDSKFSRYAHFRDAKFFGEADFLIAKFLGCVDFSHTRFSSDALFYRAQFHELADFGNARFSKQADFRNTEFSGDVSFINSSFSGNVILTGIAISDISFDFSFSIFHKELFVDEVEWSRQSYRLKIAKANLEKALRNYHLLKKVFLTMGHYRVAGELFYNETCCRRKLLSLRSIRESLPSFYRGMQRVFAIALLKDVVNASYAKRVQSVWLVRRFLSNVHRRDKKEQDSRLGIGFSKQFSDWLWMQIFYYTCGFGERPARVIGMSLATIVVFALAYYLLVPASIITAIYLSLDCFVGLAAFQSESILFAFRWLTYLEAGLGVFMISLFLVVFTRKMARD
jgi:uncharacterized protein YjbI with pentapeptide repeats